MHFTLHNPNHNTIVVFIHGFRKTSKTWNMTEKGKNIDIEGYISKRHTTLLVDISEEDYYKDTLEIASIIYEYITSIKQYKKIVVVAHSFGIFYAIHLSNIISYSNESLEFIPDVRMLAIDPTIKNETYYNFLASNTEDNLHKHKLENYDKLPDIVDIHNSTILYSHCVVRGSVFDDQIKLDKYLRITKAASKNTKSRATFHYKYSHMIHYQHPELIKESILNIIKA